MLNAPRQYTDRAGCVRAATVSIEGSVRVERDLLTRQGRKHWDRCVEAARRRAAARELDIIEREGAQC